MTRKQPTNQPKLRPPTQKRHLRLSCKESWGTSPWGLSSDLHSAGPCGLVKAGICKTCLRERQKEKEKTQIYQVSDSDFQKIRAFPDRISLSLILNLQKGMNSKSPGSWSLLNFCMQLAPVLPGRHLVPLGKLPDPLRTMATSLRW